MKKSKAAGLLILLTINLLVVYCFNIKLNIKDVLIIYAFLFGVFLVTDLIQTKLLKTPNTPVFLLLSINFSRIFACVLFLLPRILNYENSDCSRFIQR